MSAWLFRVILSALVLPAALTARGAQESSTQLPTFRAGVRLVEVDVTVRDEDDRFVDTLTIDDFEVLEGGRPQQIRNLWVVNLPVRKMKSDPLAWLRERSQLTRESSDALENFFLPDSPLDAAETLILPAAVPSDEDMGRLYVLVLDNGPGDRVRAIARQFINEFLGPKDLMAVVHVHNRELTQGLTANRELLLGAVDYFAGGVPCAPIRMRETACPGLQALKDVAVNLSASTGRRKAVLYVGVGWGLWSPEPGTMKPAAAADYGVGALKTTRAFDEVVRTATRNNVRINPIDPIGYRGGSGGSDAVASLRIIAADTGGISIANTNNYRGNFSHVVRDNSAYYLLTYTSTAEADGRVYPISVSLRNRPDLTVRTNRKSLIAPPPDVKGRSVGLPRSISAEARKVLGASTPVEGPGIELFTAVFQAPDYTGSILIGTHVPGALLRLAPKDAIELSYVAIDRWGAVRAVERRAFTLNLGAQSRAQVEQTGLRFFGRLRVPRGQYQVRVVAHQKNGATASATAAVEIPDYTEQVLTVSDFVVASSRSQTLTTLEEDLVLRDALPAQPTPERRFDRGETLTVFAEIYDSHWILSQEIGTTITVTGEHGRVVFQGEEVLRTANRGRFYLTGTLPLGAFAPGTYVLAVEAHTRKGLPANASQQMRFEVREASAPPASEPTP
jgi:VWFA-related protein